MSLSKKTSIDYNSYKHCVFLSDLPFIRIITLISILIVASFGLIDYFLDIDHLNTVLTIRFFIIIPIILTAYIISYLNMFEKIYTFILPLLHLVTGISFIFIIVYNPSFDVYYASLFLVYGFGFFLIRSHWEYILVSSILIQLVFILVTFIHLNETSIEVWVYVLFYFNFIIIGGYGSYMFYKLRIKNFANKTALENNRESLVNTISENVSDIEHSKYTTVMSLAKLSESRDSFTGKHINSVGEYSLKLASAIDESIYVKNNCHKEKLLSLIKLASTLHDIGKIGIPENILMKRGIFTSEERKIMETHCTLGSSILTSLKEGFDKNEFINMGIAISNYHHENWDGSGYPEGLSRTNIPFAARLVAIVDVYDALISERPYKKPMNNTRALKEIEKLSSIKFDPDIVKFFLKTFNNPICT